MSLNEALHILHMEKCDCLSRVRDLSYTPTREEVGKAIETVEEWIQSASKVIADAKNRTEKYVSK